MAVDQPNVCFFLPGVGSPLWEAPSLSAGTHQDGAALPVQPERPNTYHVLRGHHHKGTLKSSPPSVAPFLSLPLFMLFVSLLLLGYPVCLAPMHQTLCHPHNPFLPNLWPVLSSPPPQPFFYSAIDYSSPPSPFLTLSKTACSAESLILSGLLGAFTFPYLLHSTSVSVGLFTSPFFIPLFCLLTFLYPSLCLRLCFSP